MYNWAIVVRHELTHAFNLLQTRHRVPIWLTEGLAVYAENTNRFSQVLPVLRSRLAANTAFDLDTITRAYKRFNQPADVMLAYYQGLLYVKYIQKRFGADAIAKILAAFKTTADVAGALKLAFDVGKDEFEAGYRKYLTDVVRADGGRKPEPVMTFAELESAHKKAPDDLDLAARYAFGLLGRGKTDEARELATAVLAKEKGHPLASIVAARLHKRAMDEAGALKALEAAVAVNPDDGRLLAELGKTYFERKDYDKAAETFEKGRRVAAGEADWLDALVRVYDVAKKPGPLAELLAEQILVNPDDLALHIRLARLYANAGKPADAERVARAALYIDLKSAEAKELLLAALAEQKKDKEAAALRKRFE
jgi:tetratricopeptide (TPR) repeat protein